MVFDILVSPSIAKREPLLNEYGGGISIDDMHRFLQKKIMSQIKVTPELVGMLDTAITDHFQGPVDFYDIDGKPLGPTLSRRHRRYWEDNTVTNTFYGQAMDYFSDGSGFGWCGSVAGSINPQQSAILARFGNISPEVKRMVQNEMLKPRKIAYLPASTVEILHDEYRIYAYKQEASGKIVLWAPENIVHIKLMEMNGEVRGFSGLKSLVREIAYMYMLKDNIIAKLSNGGSPDYIISIKGANGVNKQRFEKLRTALESFSHLRKSHGNMPIDAEVNAIPLGSNLKDMEYRELAMFAVSEFCLALGVPTSRIPFMMTGAGGTTNKGELSGNSEDAYQKKINNRRSSWEDAWNQQFRLLGFTFRFRRDNLQDDVRETQAATQRAAYVAAVQTGLASRGKILTIPAQLSLLSGSKREIEQDDIEELPPELMPIPQGSPMNKNDVKNTKTDLASKPTQDMAASKKKLADNKGMNA